MVHQDHEDEKNPSGFFEPPGASNQKKVENYSGKFWQSKIVLKVPGIFSEKIGPAENL